MKTIQWISPLMYHERLVSKLWVKVLIAFTVCIFPLLFFLPFSISALLVFSLIIKRVIISLKTSKWQVISILFVFSMGALILMSNFRQIGITHGFLSFLSLMSVCKLLESRNLRDTRVLFLINIVLLMALLMYSQSIGVFIYLLFAIGVSIDAQLRVAQRNSRIINFGRWQDVLKLLALALPFTIIVFFTFPRMDAIWGLPRPNTQGVTGLPNEMSMDGLSNLVESDEISFRVKFQDNHIPAPQNLYWRGPVLWIYNGSSWQQREEDFFQTPENIQIAGSSKVSYTLTPAKADLDWLPALDVAIEVSGKYELGSSYQMRLPLVRKGEQRFNIVSALRYRMNSQKLSLRDRQYATQLPVGLFIPRTRELAQKFYKVGGNSVEGFAEQFFQYVRNNEFYYSLEPMPGASNVENFLFDKNGSFGFCQHYANAMTIAARSIDIPARVVIGYQGGTFNPLSEYFVVREESAHAWVELWIENRGWVRFDPTAAVAPYRIQRSELSADSLRGEDKRSAVSRYAEKFGAISWARDVLDATQSFWQNWVIDLNDSRQNSLLGILSWLGLGTKIMLAIVIAVLVVFLAVFLYRWERRPRQDEDALARVARKTLARLEKRGLQKRHKETVADFLRRIATEYEPKNASIFIDVAENYERIRYRENAEKKDMDNTIKLLRKLRFS